MRRLSVVAVLAACQQDAVVSAIRDEVELPPEPPELGPERVEEVLRQRIPERIDVLWVVDNSGSMLAEQRKLAENFPRFLEFYRDSGLDWQIGVISTDTTEPLESGKLQGAAGYLWVDPSVPDPVSVFADMAQLGRQGSAAERGRRAIWLALEDPDAQTWNEGFFRKDAKLSIIIVSDENDATSSDPTIAELGDTLSATGREVVISAILSGDNPCGANKTGTEYAALVAATGGVSFDICAEDWSPFLTELGIAAAGLKRTFYLTRRPVETDIEVWIEDAGTRIDFQPADWSYDPVTNAITFASYTPRAAADVHVAYTLRATVGTE